MNGTRMGWTGGLPPAPPGGWGAGLAPESRSPSVCPGQSQAPGIASEIAALVAQEDLHRTPTPPHPHTSQIVSTFYGRPVGANQASRRTGSLRPGEVVVVWFVFLSPSGDNAARFAPVGGFLDGWKRWRAGRWPVRRTDRVLGPGRHRPGDRAGPDRPDRDPAAVATQPVAWPAADPAVQWPRP